MRFFVYKFETGSGDIWIQLALLVGDVHLLQRGRCQLVGVAGGAKRFKARLADFHHTVCRFLEEFARIKVGGIFRQVTTH